MAELGHGLPKAAPATLIRIGEKLP